MELNAKVKLLLIVLMVSALGFGIQMYYDEVKDFLVYTSPVYRGFTIFMLCFLGASTVLIPIPYTAAILTLTASVPELNLLEIVFWGGLGSGLGEVTGWIVGKYLGESFGSLKHGRRLKILSALVAKHRLIIPVIVFLYALTPLPDDAIFIILGAIGYKLIYTLVSGLAGKMAMMYIIGFFGKLMGEYMPGWISSALAIALILVFLALVEFIDWEKLAERYLKPSSTKEGEGKV